MALTRIYEPQQGKPMRIAGFMSGSGSNLVHIIEHERKIKSNESEPIYEVAVIFSDRVDSKARAIGERYGVRVETRDFDAFNANGRYSEEEVSVAFDRQTRDILEPLGIDVIACGGYMRRLTDVLLSRYLCVNVHPGNLLIRNEEGKRAYTGKHAVQKAILKGASHIRSTTHIMNKDFDQGPVLMLSAPLYFDLLPEFDKNDKAQLDALAAEYQERLKRVGDWVIFPKTIEMLARGKFARDEQGNFYLDDLQIPQR